MVKRAKSPDATDDARYMTVYQPYPMNANWELPSDVIAFAFWIAGCIGMEPLLGVHYKPKARGMVLLEIDKAYPEHERLLGEHRWTEFLKNPRADEKERISQIFYCLYDTGRAAQKDGWKRIHVESHWFKDWSPNNGVIHKPYPTTHWCPVPPEDKTNKPLCRPLPVKVKPPPPKAPAPVVGSSTWVDTRNGPSANTPKALTGAWAKKQANVNAGVKTPPALGWDKPIMTNTNSKPTTPSAMSPITTSGGGGKNANVWGPPLPGGKPNTSPSVARPPNSPWGPVAPRSGNVWVKQDANKPTSTAVPNTPTNATSSPDESGWPSEPATTSTSTPTDTKATANPIERLKEGEVMISLSPSQEKDLYGLGSDEDEDDLAEMNPDEMELAYVAPWEKTAIAASSAGDLWGGYAGSSGGEGGQGQEVGRKGANLWSDEPPPDPTAGQLMCPIHGKLCKKGICSEMSKLVREEERKKREAERAGKKGKGRKGGRNASGDNNDNPSGGWRSNNSNSSTTNAWGDTTSNNGGGDNGSSNGGGSVADDDVDEDGFSAVPRGKRGVRARGGRGGRGKVVVSAGERGGNGGTGEKSMLGKMRGFDDDKESVVGSENGWAKDWAE